MKRRVFLSVMVVALMGSMAFGAEGDKPKEGKGKGRGGEALAAALEKANLSDDQKAQIKKIQEEGAAAAKAAGEDREARRKIYTETREKMMGVLTEDQKAIVKKHMEENRPKRPEGEKKKPE